MTKYEEFDRMKRIIDDAGYGLLATCSEGQPRVRPMAVVLLDDGRLWCSTYNISGKYREMEANPNVEFCFVARNRVQLRVTGTADLSGGPDKKRRLLRLNPRVARHFTDENDPKFVHIEIIPTHIRWTEPGFGEYHDIRLG